MSWHERLNDVIHEKGGLRLPKTVHLQEWLPVARHDPEELRAISRAATKELQTPVKDIPWDDGE